MHINYSSNVINEILYIHFLGFIQLFSLLFTTCLIKLLIFYLTEQLVCCTCSPFEVCLETQRVFCCTMNLKRILSREKQQDMCERKTAKRENSQKMRERAMLIRNTCCCNCCKSIRLDIFQKRILQIKFE